MVETAERIRLGQLEIRFLLEGGASAGTLAVFEVDVPANARVPIAHSHDAYEETIYGLRGTLAWTVEGRVHNVGPGEVLCIPRGAVHRFDNNTSGDAKVLCMVTPAAIGPLFFREVAEVLKAAGGGPPDGARMMEIMLRYGLTPALPPQVPA